MVKQKEGGVLMITYQNFLFLSFSRGDPVIHTMAAAVLLRKSQIHYWETIGYQVADQFVHCPVEKSLYKSGICRPIANFDHQGYSCLPKFLE